MLHPPEQTALPGEEILTADEVVSRYKLKSKDALYVMRSRGNGPRGFRVGKELRFRLADLHAWEESRADEPSDRSPVTPRGRSRPGPASHHSAARSATERNDEPIILRATDC